MNGILHSQIQKIIGIKRMIPGQWTEYENELGVKEENVRIISYWLAEIRCFQHRYPEDEVAIGIVKTNEWSKGVLLVRSLHDTSRLVIGVNPYRTVDVSDRYDVVAKTLKSINVFPEKTSEIFSSPHCKYSIRFGTEFSFGTFVMGPHHPAGRGNFDNLRVALMTTVLHFARLYDDDEIKAYVRYQELIEKYS